MSMNGLKEILSFVFLSCLFIEIVNADFVIQLGDTASITITEDTSGPDFDDVYADIGAVIQLGEYRDVTGISNSCFDGSFNIVLDPFAPLGSCMDGHVESSSLLQITPGNFSETTASDFKLFSFFSSDKTTIGWMKNRCGASGIGSHQYIFYDLESKQVFDFAPTFCEQTHWIDIEQRPPIVGVTESKYWWFQDRYSYNTYTTYITRVWSGSDLPEDHPISQGVMRKEYQDAVAGLDESVLKELSRLAPGSNTSVVANEPDNFGDQLSRLFKFLYYAKKTGHISEAKAIVDSLPLELRQEITDTEYYEDWYEIIDPYRH